MGNSFYKYLVLGLVILNIGILAFFLLTKPSHQRPKPPGKNRIPKDLQLDDQQIIQFEELRDIHKNEMTNKREEQQKLLRKYFGEKTSTENDSIVLDSFLQLEKEKLELTEKHFDDIKGILKNDQLKLFQRFKERSLRSILGSENPRPRRN